MHGALDGFIVEGIKTTIPLQKRILAEPDFIAVMAEICGQQALEAVR